MSKFTRVGRLAEQNTINIMEEAAAELKKYMTLLTPDDVRLLFWGLCGYNLLKTFKAFIAEIGNIFTC